MSEDHLPYLLGYPASFCMTPDEARGNILRMIEAEIPGWNGGPAVWAACLRAQLGRANRTRKLNRYGAKFSAVEWVWVMRSLVMDCERLLAIRGGATETTALVATEDPLNLDSLGPGPDAQLHGTAGLQFPLRASA